MSFLFSNFWWSGHCNFWANTHRHTEHSFINVDYPPKNGLGQFLANTHKIGTDTHFGYLYKMKLNPNLFRGGVQAKGRIFWILAFNISIYIIKVPYLKHFLKVAFCIWGDDECNPSISQSGIPCANKGSQSIIFQEQFNKFIFISRFTLACWKWRKSTKSLILLIIKHMEQYPASQQLLHST